MSDMTIRDCARDDAAPALANPAWIKGHALGPDRGILIVDVETAGGITGMGYLFPLPARAEVRSRPSSTEVDRPAREGQGREPPSRRSGRTLWDFTMTYGRGGVALHGDVGARHRAVGRGRQAREPAAASPVGPLPLEDPIYGSGCFRGAGGDGMIEKALTYVKQGYKAIKMQVAHVHTLAQDLGQRAAHARGARARHRHHDRRQHGLGRGDRDRDGRKFEEYDIYWLEEPVPADDFAGYQRIAAALDMRVVGGETHFTRYDLRPFFINPCLPILQPDPMRGGMTDLRKIATLADTWGITIAPHLFPELNVHLLASIPNGIWARTWGCWTISGSIRRDRGRLHHGAGAAGARARFKEEVRREFSQLKRKVLGQRLKPSLVARSRSVISRLVSCTLVAYCAIALRARRLRTSRRRASRVGLAQLSTDS
jgi:L-alanine-DL-glutamate epimerase-like enolase superfamily enzyme